MRVEPVRLCSSAQPLGGVTAERAEDWAGGGCCGCLVVVVVGVMWVGAKDSSNAVSKFQVARGQSPAAAPRTPNGVALPI